MCCPSMLKDTSARARVRGVDDEGARVDDELEAERGEVEEVDDLQFSFR